MNWLVKSIALILVGVIFLLSLVFDIFILKIFLFLILAPLSIYALGDLILLKLNLKNKYNKIILSFITGISFWGVLTFFSEKLELVNIRFISLVILFSIFYLLIKVILKKQNNSFDYKKYIPLILLLILVFTLISLVKINYQIPSSNAVAFGPYNYIAKSVLNGATSVPSDLVPQYGHFIFFLIAGFSFLLQIDTSYLFWFSPYLLATIFISGNFILFKRVLKKKSSYILATLFSVLFIVWDFNSLFPCLYSFEMRNWLMASYPWLFLFVINYKDIYIKTRKDSILTSVYIALLISVNFIFLYINNLFNYLFLGLIIIILVLSSFRKKTTPFIYLLLLINSLFIFHNLESFFYLAFIFIIFFYSVFRNKNIKNDITLVLPLLGVAVYLILEKYSLDVSTINMYFNIPAAWEPAWNLEKLFIAAGGMVSVLVIGLGFYKAIKNNEDLIDWYFYLISILCLISLPVADIIRAGVLTVVIIPILLVKILDKLNLKKYIIVIISSSIILSAFLNMAVIVEKNRSFSWYQDINNNITSVEDSNGLVITDPITLQYITSLIGKERIIPFSMVLYSQQPNDKVKVKIIKNKILNASTPEEAVDYMNLLDSKYVVFSKFTANWLNEDGAEYFKMSLNEDVKIRNEINPIFYNSSFFTEIKNEEDIYIVKLKDEFTNQIKFDHQTTFIERDQPLEITAGFDGDLYMELNYMLLSKSRYEIKVNDEKLVVYSNDSNINYLGTFSEGDVITISDLPLEFAEFYKPAYLTLFKASK